MNKIYKLSARERKHRKDPDRWVMWEEDFYSIENVENAIRKQRSLYSDCDFQIHTYDLIESFSPDI